MHCPTFAIVLVVLLLSIPSFLQFLQNGCSKKSGMVGGRGMLDDASVDDGHRQIRDDPSQTCYSQQTDGINPQIIYGDRQY
jgi:hypothetical protein